MNNNTEKWTLEDGRRAERRVVDNVAPTGEGERTIELHVEDERPLKLQQRIVEKSKPFIYERETHTVDKNGNIVEKKVESAEPKISMQLVEHIATESEHKSLMAQNVSDNDCHVTKEEMIDTIITAVKTLKEDLTSKPAVVTKPSVVDEIGKRVGSKPDTVQTIMYGVIAVLIAGLGYVLFIM